MMIILDMATYNIFACWYAVPMIQKLETTLRAGAVPQAPQFKPATVAPATQNPNSNKEVDAKASSEGEPDASEEPKKSKNECELPAVKPAGEQENSAANGVAGDPLGNARTKVQEEIGREFAAIMATGTFRASEAAALATRRVMQKYGHMNVAQS